ncbi:MAG: inorganic diphosphatase [Flavobacteriales bacterium]|nr:inorganic diphosphatase [Flavobacteriales bacterium]
MNTYLSHSLKLKYSCILVCLLATTGCFNTENTSKPKQEISSQKANEEKLNLLEDFPAMSEDGDVNAVIEIPTGTIEKWEVSKSTGQLELEEIDGAPRLVNYLGYPGNYGMIPRTLLPKEMGGDGDPLDILVLGPPEEKGSVVICKVIGVLKLIDRGEQDDKLVAVSTQSAFYKVNDLEELASNYGGVTNIIETWFTNYKGPGKMISNGFGDKQSALNILNVAIEQYEFSETRKEGSEIN